MAKPRIFISSTFYDLRSIRADLERFVSQMGYEPVLNERGTIPYAKNDSLEDNCLKEIDLCDMLVAIIGGRFGTGSQRESYSISQSEIKTAIEQGRQVHIFVDKNVLAEFSTYQINKENRKINYKHVDNVLVYKFLEEIHALPKNNAIAPFETSEDIVTYLKNQWAGIFQRLLQEESRKEEIRIIRELQNTSETLNRLVTYLTEERKGQTEAIQSILLFTHPAFERIKELLRITYRVFFTNVEELSALVKARSFKPVDKPQWDSPDYQEWFRKDDELTSSLFKVATSLFNDRGQLKSIAKDEWHLDLIKLEKREDDLVPEDEDIPF